MILSGCSPLHSPKRLAESWLLFGLDRTGFWKFSALFSSEFEWKETGTRRRSRWLSRSIDSGGTRAANRQTKLSIIAKVTSTQLTSLWNSLEKLTSQSDLLLLVAEHLFLSFQRFLRQTTQSPGLLSRPLLLVLPLQLLLHLLRIPQNLSLLQPIPPWLTLEILPLMSRWRMPRSQLVRIMK